MASPLPTILEHLASHNVSYERLDHEAVYTSDQAAAVRGIVASQGAKSLLLKTKAGFILAVVPGDCRLDSKKLKTLLGVKELRFATRDEVQQTMGCEIGACYPFGTLLGLRTVVDERLLTNSTISFNPGDHRVTLKISAADYVRSAQPELADIVS